MANNIFRDVFVTTAQSRLGKSHDNMRRKLLDNQKRLISSPVDCIRVKSKKSFEGDSISWICEKADVLSIVFPPMTDVPIRKIRESKDSPGHYQLTSLVSTFNEGEQEKFFTCECIHQQDLDVDDLLFRIMFDESTEYPTVLIIKVQELLGDIGEHEVISYKFHGVLNTEEVPQDIVDTVMDMVKRRKTIGW